MAEPWKPCSTCKKPILHGARYWRCSVSTCNSGRFQLAFCSVGCWDAHVPAMSHRGSAAAIEERAPTSSATPAAPVEPARRVVRPPGEAAEPEDVLIVASRLKEFVRARADFNTSADVMEALSDIVRGATIDAIDNARAEGRRTVMARDFRRR